MRTIPLAAACAAILIPLGGRAAAQSGPSYDCDDASTSTEIAICGSGRLARLEMEMFRAYERLVGRVGAEEARRIADDLLEERQACGGDPACIETMLTVSAGVFGQVGAVAPTALSDAIQAELARREADREPGIEASLTVRPAPRPSTSAEREPTPPPAALPDAAAGEEGAGQGGAPVVAAASRSSMTQAFAALPVDERTTIERNLTDAGLSAEEVDGVWSEATERALLEVIRRTGEDGSPIDVSDAGGADVLLDFVGSEAFVVARQDEAEPTDFEW